MRYMCRIRWAKFGFPQVAIVIVRSRVGTNQSGMLVQGTHCPKDASSKKKRSGSHRHGFNPTKYSISFSREIVRYTLYNTVLNVWSGIWLDCRMQCQKSQAIKVWRRGRFREIVTETESISILFPSVFLSVPIYLQTLVFHISIQQRIRHGLDFFQFFRENTAIGVKMRQQALKRGNMR
jgi:hypothetical protein